MSAFDNKLNLINITNVEKLICVKNAKDSPDIEREIREIPAPEGSDYNTGL